ncbi:MAG: family 31 glucosidase [Candidatus Poribacteria bacterium]|nr:family 31 glucosidase [Candidatus Poribacteria bacterium]
MNDMNKRSSQVNNRLVHRLEGQVMVIEAWGRDGLRVRVTTGSEILDTAWALTEPVNASAAIEISETEATVRNGKISARIHDIRTQKGCLQFFRHPGEAMADAKTCILSEQDYAVHAHNPGTRTFRSVGNGLNHTELHFAARNSERFYGMGLNDTGTVNLKGCVIDLYQRHVKHVVPFVVSSEGYGLLWNNPSLGRVEFGQNLTRWVSYGCRQLDYYITAADSYADIMENYASVTGHAPAFPYWASGFWQCKLRYKTQDEFLGVAREFKRRGLPLAVHVIDFLHWKRTGDWKLDPEFWPNPKEMVEELDDMGVRIMISPWILVDEESENFADMQDRGLFTGSVDGQKDTVNGPSQPHEKRHKYQYDPTHPEAGKFLWRKWKENYVDLGIRTFWLDPCDDFHAIQDYDQVQYHIGSGTEVHNYFPVAHQKTIYEGLLDAGENEVVTICRSSWAGSQRYGASPAAHDIESSFKHLEAYMKAGLNLAMSGIPWGAAEIGGFVTPDNTSDRFHELMVRWYQYGVFTPIFRTHGNRPNNEAWTIGGDSYRHIRAAMILRERLRPYVMAQMKLASDKGTPPMRPLFFDFENDPEVANIEDQFLFGADLLIAPILGYQVRSRAVYLPAGTDWTDAWTKEKLSGGQTVHADAPLERIPIFVRGNNNAELVGLFSDLYEVE